MVQRLWKTLLPQYCACRNSGLVCTTGATEYSYHCYFSVSLQTVVVFIWNLWLSWLPFFSLLCSCLFVVAELACVTESCLVIFLSFFWTLHILVSLWKVELMMNSGSCEPRLIVAVSSHSQYHYFAGVYQQSVCFPCQWLLGLDWIGLQCGCGLLGVQNSCGAGCAPVGRLAVRSVHS